MIRDRDLRAEMIYAVLLPYLGSEAAALRGASRRDMREAV
jgi:hypothetical protein